MAETTSSEHTVVTLIAVKNTRFFPGVISFNSHNIMKLILSSHFTYEEIIFGNLNWDPTPNFNI